MWWLINNPFVGHDHTAKHMPNVTYQWLACAERELTIDLSRRTHTCVDPIVIEHQKE